MLSDSKQRNDVLSQAYQSLHAEYLKLKTSAQHQQMAAHHHQLPATTTTTYGAGPSSISAFADPSALGLPNPALDLDVYGYADLTTYTHI